MNAFFNQKGFVSCGILNVSPKDAYELCQQGAILIDVREAYMNRFKMFDVDEIIFCPKTLLEQLYIDFPKEKALIFIDAAGIHSKEAVLFLIEKGYENVVNVAGGLVEWERDGLPLKIDTSERLSGSCACMLRKREKRQNK
ncbi:MAG: rhodanese-like domain-containing protein [Ignavibacteria bacterium]|nr:rhodanese-like domain-containing protein [Ignavibacteria bacterium]